VTLPHLRINLQNYQLLQRSPYTYLYDTGDMLPFTKFPLAKKYYEYGLTIKDNFFEHLLLSLLYGVSCQNKAKEIYGNSGTYVLVCKSIT
jgi:hypothetical protein